jgi:hypothetical protein
VNTTGQRAEHADGKPTIVLVHGAFADASSWNGVIGRLQRQAVTDHIVKAAQATVGSGR